MHTCFSTAKLQKYLKRLIIFTMNLEMSSKSKTCRFQQVFKIKSFGKNEDTDALSNVKHET